MFRQTGTAQPLSEGSARKAAMFTLELPVGWIGDNCWVRDDGVDLGGDYRNYPGGPVLVARGFTREGLHEVQLMRLNAKDEIVETLLVCFRHQVHDPAKTEEVAANGS